MSGATWWKMADRGEFLERISAMPEADLRLCIGELKQAITDIQAHLERDHARDRPEWRRRAIDAKSLTDVKLALAKTELRTRAGAARTLQAERAEVRRILGARDDEGPVEAALRVMAELATPRP